MLTAEDDEHSVLIKELEREQRMRENNEVKEKRSAFYDMLTQPYQPPAMFYQKKEVLPQRNAHVKKAPGAIGKKESPDR